MDAKTGRKKSLSSIEETERILPHEREFEEAIIGALLLESRAFETAKEIIADGEMFYDSENRIVYNAVRTLDEERKAIDLLTVMEQLRKEGNLEAVGGVSRLVKLSSRVVSAAHLEHHCKVVKQLGVKRKFIEQCYQSLSLAFDSTQDIDDILFENSRWTEALLELAAGKIGIRPLNEILKDCAVQMYLRKENAAKGIQPGITTGLADLNRRTGGWQKSELIIIAARPGIGKTAMSLHFAKRAAKTGTQVAMFSLEMSDVSLGNRLLLSETNIDPDNFKLGILSNQDTVEVEKAIGKLYDHKIYVDPNASVTMSYIRTQCRLLKKRGQCEMVIIDYLQLVGEKGDRNRNRENEVSQMSREAKLIAKELDVPVILLSQLNRDVDKRTKKVPVLADLRESGAIEQDADMVIFIHRPEYYSGNENEKGYGELIIAKYRNGSTGKIPFKYNESLTKIYDFDGPRLPSAIPVKHHEQSLPF